MKATQWSPAGKAQAKNGKGWSKRMFSDAVRCLPDSQLDPAVRAVIADWQKEAPKWDQLLQQFLWQNHLSSHYQEVIKLINRDAGLSHAERIVHKLRGSQVALKCLYNLVRQDDKDEMMEPCDHADSAEFDRALLAIKEAFEKGDKQLALKINELWQAVKENADSCSKSQADHSKSDDSKTAGADVAAEEEAVASDEKLIAEKEGSNRPQRERVKKTRGS